MPSVCTVFVTFVQCFRVARAGNVPNLPVFVLVLVPLYSASLGQPGQCTSLPVFVLVLVPLVQCFAWSARAMYLFARVRTRTGTPCTCFARPAGQCAYLPVFVLVLCVNRCTVCTVLVLLVQHVPICSCSYSYWYPFVQCFA